MKTFLPTALIAVLLAVPMAAQAPDARNEQQLVALLKEVQTQQAQIAENQGKIEAKLADLAETLRVARIFAGKAGK
jgi:endonuclease III